MNWRFIFPEIFLLPVLLFIFIFLYSLRRHDFHLAGKLALATGILLVPSGLLWWGATAIIETANPFFAWLIFALSLCINIVLFYYLWHQLPKLISLFFLNGAYDSNQILRKYSQDLSSITNPEQLAKISIGLICQALNIRRGILFEAFPEQESADSVYHLVAMGCIGIELPEEATFAPGHPLLELLRQTRQPLTWKDLEQTLDKKALSAEEFSWLQNLSAEIIVPIHSGHEWVGVIALGPKISSRPYRSEELTLISTLADQLSLAIKNARLVDSLSRVNHDFRRAYQAMEQSNRHVQQALSQLQKIDQTKSDFISIASHELRTPVTIMRGYTEILLEEPDLVENDYHLKMLKGIHLGIMRLNEIIETMLDMASIDARALSLQKIDVSLVYLIQSLTKSLKLTLQQRNIQLTIEGISGLPLIRADQEALRKVFYHLLQNAVQNTPDHGKIGVSGLIISPGQAGLPEGGVEIIVSDTGIGIKREQLDLIFTKFYQVSEPQHHSSGRTKFKGSGPGLGLAIAKGIVEAHGGKIWVESPGYDEEKCPGSQFHVILPT